ncbi:MAG TPA: NAD(P)H-binding protein [Solirubrobacteraceae bacterium]|nr:NAD(P)H-binding protein [Solirubrobacteraceae bacterium]
MRIFVAGASGVIGIRLVPLLVADGHDVAGMTRTPAKAEGLRELGAQPVVCDVFDAPALEQAVVAFGPEIVIHQLTDLPDDEARIADFGSRNDRVRDEGTGNLLAAMRAAGATRILVQSIAWDLGGERGEATKRFERRVFDAGGVVIQYGQLYGPGTYYEDEPPSAPRVHVDEAARRTVALLDSEPGVVQVVETV